MARLARGRPGAQEGHLRPRAQVVHHLVHEVEGLQDQRAILARERRVAEGRRP